MADSAAAVQIACYSAQEARDNRCSSAALGPSGAGSSSTARSAVGQSHQSNRLVGIVEESAGCIAGTGSAGSLADTV